ncbi:thioredoxin family protein [Chitinophaga pendula]|uniref:thioredoxin family protein n=1 Tax=Chitinophaga TaxID=79328 RepID=UPI000BAEAA2C|nr:MULTISPECIES: thioredoxin family protein [Chitinophaga]ASZ11648.1 thioredoxin family protein [Chitinophaga sp. MD30]UCJ05339.1 thioredoxin family protein [Chitinophaga pendula]
MARTPSHMVPLGAPAPDFTLLDVVSGEEITLSARPAVAGTVILFICNHCPFVRYVNGELVRLARDYMSKGIDFIAISSNDAVQYPQDGPDEMKANALEQGYPFPYLYDETQEVAAAYQAACTPDYFLYDGDLRLVYRGQLDDARPGNDQPLNGKDLRAALDALLGHEEISPLQKPSLGCNIKWKQKEPQR